MIMPPDRVKVLSLELLDIASLLNNSQSASHKRCFQDKLIQIRQVIKKNDKTLLSSISFNRHMSKHLRSILFIVELISISLLILEIIHHASIHAIEGSLSISQNYFYRFIPHQQASKESYQDLYSGYKYHLSQTPTIPPHINIMHRKLQNFIVYNSTAKMFTFFQNTLQYEDLCELNSFHTLLQSSYIGATPDSYISFVMDSITGFFFIGYIVLLMCEVLFERCLLDHKSTYNNRMQLQDMISMLSQYLKTNFDTKYLKLISLAITKGEINETRDSLHRILSKSNSNQEYINLKKIINLDSSLFYYHITAICLGTLFGLCYTLMIDQKYDHITISGLLKLIMISAFIIAHKMYRHNI